MPRRFPRLSAADLLNLAVEAPDAPMHVAALAVVDGAAWRDPDGALRLDDLRAAIDRRLAAVPQLRRVLYRPGPLAGRPLWIDYPRFRVQEHVAAVEVPAPGDEAALLRLTARLMAVPLPRSRPLWRIWFVTGLPAGRAAVIVVLHHVVADGLAAIHLITTLLGGAEPGPPDPASRVAGEPPRWRALVADNAAAGLAALRRARPGRVVARLRFVAKTFAHAWRAPRTSLTVPVGASRRLAVLRLDLDEARTAAHRAGATVNDLVLDLAAGGIRALLRERGEPVERLRLHVSVAVSLRGARAATPRASGTDGPGNQTGGMLVRLPLHPADAAARLRLVRAETAAVKRAQLFTVANGFLTGLAGFGVLRWFTRRQRMSNLAASNVVGPAEPIELLGAPVLDLIPVGNLAGNLALGFLALSYAGRLVITVQADGDRFPDLPVLVAAARRDWTELASESVHSGR